MMCLSRQSRDLRLPVAPPSEPREDQAWVITQEGPALLLPFLGCSTFSRPKFGLIMQSTSLERVLAGGGLKGFWGGGVADSRAVSSLCNHQANLVLGALRRWSMLPTIYTEKVGHGSISTGKDTAESTTACTRESSLHPPSNHRMRITHCG